MKYADRNKRILPTISLDDSYRLCRRRVRDALARYGWLASSLSRDSRRHVEAILALSARSARLSDVHTGRAARLEMLDDLREDMRDNLMGEESTDQFPALFDTVRRFDIPLQFPHDIVSAADYCLRHERMETFDQWLQAGQRLGGGTVLSIAAIFHARGKEFWPAAVACGQAVWLTHLLDNVARDVQTLQFWLPARDVATAGVDLQRHRPDDPEPELAQLIESLATRIEPLFELGSAIVRYTDLDGQRSFGSLLAVFRDRLHRLQRHPASVLEGGTSRGTAWQHRLRHLLGWPGPPPSH